LYQWDTPVNSSRNGIINQTALISTFLPLSPCNHWVHYRCLIWLASSSDPQSRDKCTQCHTHLFQWEGITALTLAARTGIDMENHSTIGTLASTSFAGSHSAWYEADCAVIESIIHAQCLGMESKYVDFSPDLVQRFFAVLNTLESMGKPSAPWLKFETRLGSLLWIMLVTIKIRRYLIAKHRAIQGTERLRRFDEWGATLQNIILEELHTG
jgi:hypothetical protein